MTGWRLALALVIVLAIAGAYVWGRRDGAALIEARHAVQLQRAQTKAVQAAELASRKEADRLAAQTELDDLARDLEDQANADPAGGVCLPVARVLRLNRR